MRTIELKLTNERDETVHDIGICLDGPNDRDVRVFVDRVPLSGPPTDLAAMRVTLRGLDKLIEFLAPPAVREALISDWKTSSRSSPVGINSGGVNSYPRVYEVYHHFDTTPHTLMLRLEDVLYIS